MLDAGPDWVLEYPGLRERRGSANFQERYLSGASAWVRRYRYFTPLLPFTDATLAALSGCARSRPRVAFLANRFVGLARAAHDAGLDSMVFATNPHEVALALAHRLPVASLFAATGHVNSAALAASSDEQRRRVIRAVELVGRTLRSVAPSVIVVPNDSLPLPRAVVLAARLRGTPIVCIQDGIYMPSDHPDDLHGYESDVVLVWGEFFRGLYNRARQPNVRVFGYPHPVPHGSRGATVVGSPKTVCFIGQPFEAYDHSLEAHKLDIVRTVVEAANRAGWDVVYRPHHGESTEARQLVGAFVTMAPRQERLGEALARYDAFVGINSTVLIQAGIHGKSAAQLRHPAFGDDDFEAYGAAASVDAHTIDDVARFLRSVERGTHVRYPRANVVKVCDDVGESFRTWMEAFLGASSLNAPSS